MKKLFIGMTLALVLGLLAACGGDKADLDELLPLEVDLVLPDEAEQGEIVEINANVSYGGEAVNDAKVVFEIWNIEDKDDSIKIDATNNEDGSYSISHEFEEDGVYEMYAHTDAHDLHTMPKGQINIK